MDNLKKIIRNCKQATFLIEKKAAGTLSLREAVILQIHLYGCAFCRLFNRQSSVINEMVRSLFRDARPQVSARDDEFRKALTGRIVDALNKN